MLDINLFREDNGQGHEIIRESQRRRFANVELVDETIRLSSDWRQCRFELENLHNDFMRIAKEVVKLKSAGADTNSTIKDIEDIKQSISEKDAEFHKVQAALTSRWELIGNLVHDSVPVSNDKANNAVVRTWGEKRLEPSFKNHVDLVQLLDIVDTKRGSTVTGGKGFYLKGDGVLLNQALINFSLTFLSQRGYTSLQTPFFTRKDITEKCVQLAHFNEEIYKVTGEGDDKFLVATAEQSLFTYHIGEWINQNQLPLRYAGYSSCFHTKAAAHGQDTLGNFRLHQFEKVEHLCITGPIGNDSWDMHEEMINNFEEFYQMLKLPYQIAAVVSGALNAADAKKYDLQAWFPASNAYRELGSCSNCTDYQSRHLMIKYEQKKSNEQARQYVHLLNGTLTSTERTICCILENYQKEDGVEIPEVLRPFMGGRDFLPFRNPRT